MFKHISATITNIILRTLSAIVDRVLQFREDNALYSIRKIPNAEIDYSFRSEEGCSFSISPKIRRLKIGDRVFCRKNCNFVVQEDASLVINDNVFFNNSCSINCLHEVEIGENTLFGENVRLYDHNHDYETSPIVAVDRTKFKVAPVVIGKNCWIGSGVTILKGVTIGDNVIVGANCLIYKSISSNQVIRLKQEYL